jgi:hypothetical protein
MKVFSNMEPCLKPDLFQQRASSSGIPPWGADNISQPRVDEETTRGRGLPDQSCKKPASSIEVTCLGASDCSIPPQGASGTSIPVD